MRNLVILLCVAILSLVPAVDSAAQRDRGGESKTIRLGKKEFLKRVADYENSPSEWKYLGDKPAIIDFYADWCGPCRRLAPLLDELAKEYEKEIYIYKVNVDSDKEIAEAFGITSLPTIVFVPLKGRPSAGVGFLPKDVLKKAVDEILLNRKAE